MKIDIVDVVGGEAKKITKAIMDKYDEYSFSFETQRVKKEIYTRSLHEATAFFLKNGWAKFDDSIIEDVRGCIQRVLKNPKVLNRLTPEVLLANAIEIEVFDLLLEWGDIAEVSFDNYIHTK